MEIEPLSSLQSTLPEDGWRRLRTFLGSVDEGQSVDLVTPFFPKEWRSNPKGYARWYYDNIASSGTDEINELEEGEVEKFGPFSIRLPWVERKDGILEYFSQKVVHEERYLKLAFDKMKRWLPKHALQPNSFKASFSAMPKDSNLGLPWFTRDRNLAKDYLKRAEDLRASGFSQRIYDAPLGWRGQPNGTNKPKQRGVWMMDHLDTIVGLSIQAPLLEKLKLRSEFAAWNELSRVDRVVTSMIDATREEIFSADFSSFDKLLPGVVLEYVYELKKLWFSTEAKAQLEWLKSSLLTVGLVTPDGIYHGRTGGMPSGAANTNIDDSLGQLLMILAFAGFGTVLGDDGVYNLTVSPEELSDALLSLYGMKISSSKGSVSRDVVSYLQRLHLRKYRVHGLCVGVRSLVRTWNGVCHQERGHSGLPPEFFSARAIMQLENAKWHPKFRRAVEYYRSLDKFARELDAVEIFKRAGGVKFVEDVLGLTSFRFGVELPSAGLNTFETVKLLRSMNGARIAA